MKPFFVCLLLLSTIAKAQVQTVTLNGSASFDPDGSIASYKWAVVGTPPIQCVITNADKAIATVVPINGQQWKVGIYKFQLQVTDNQGGIALDTTTITVNPNPDKPPLLDIGQNKTIQLPQDSIKLTAVASDPDGNIAVYQWDKLSGGDVQISGGSTANVTIKGFIAGTYLIRCRVTDNAGWIVSDTVTITVLPANQLPKVDAGADQVIRLPVNSVAVGGVDLPKGVAVKWEKVSGSNSYKIVSPFAATTQITGLVAGDYIFRKTAGGVSDDVKVTVKKKCSFICQLFGCCK